MYLHRSDSTPTQQYYGIWILETYPKMTSSPYFIRSLTGTSSPFFFGEFIRLDLLQRQKGKERKEKKPKRKPESDGDTGEDKTTVTHTKLRRIANLFYQSLATVGQSFAGVLLCSVVLISCRRIFLRFITNVELVNIASNLFRSTRYNNGRGSGTHHFCRGGRPKHFSKYLTKAPRYVGNAHFLTLKH